MSQPNRTTLQKSYTYQLSHKWHQLTTQSRWWYVGFVDSHELVLNAVKKQLPSSGTCLWTVNPHLAAFSIRRRVKSSAIRTCFATTKVWTQISDLRFPQLTYNWKLEQSLTRNFKQFQSLLLQMTETQREMMYTLRRRQKSWLGHILRHDLLLRTTGGVYE